jgi:hypothetical protein
MGGRRERKPTGHSIGTSRAGAVSWAALAVAVVAFVVALAGGAIGLPGRDSVRPNDLSRGVTRALDDPRAYALVVGPGEVRERYSRGITDEDVSVNNGAFCIRDEIGFEPKHAQVTPQVADAVPRVFLNDTAACNGGTAVVFESDLTYPEDFFVALFK